MSISTKIIENVEDGPWSLPEKQMRLYLWMMYNSDENGVCSHAKKYMAKAFGYKDTKSIRDQINGLLTKGYIKEEIRGGTHVHPHTPLPETGNVVSYQVVTSGWKCRIPPNKEMGGNTPPSARRAPTTSQLARNAARRD